MGLFLRCVVSGDDIVDAIDYAKVVIAVGSWVGVLAMDGEDGQERGVGCPDGHFLKELAMESFEGRF